MSASDSSDDDERTLLERAEVWASETRGVGSDEIAQRREALRRLAVFVEPSAQNAAERARSKLLWGLSSRVVFSDSAPANALPSFVDRLIEHGFGEVRALRAIDSMQHIDLLMPLSELIAMPDLVRVLHEIADHDAEEPLLDLSELSALTSLPPLRDVAGSVFAFGLRALTGLDEGLEVHGSLGLRNCGLRSLPRSLTVHRNLHLRGCADLQLPADASGIVVHGVLDLSASGVREIPDDGGLACGAELDLDSCQQLRSIGRGLRVGSSLNARFCPRLERISEDISVGSFIETQGCARLEELPPKLPIRGGLGASHCERLRVLPAEIEEIDGNLFAAGLPRLEALPPLLQRVGKILNVNACQQLRALPETLREVGMLELSDSGVQRLPDGLVVRGDCNAIRCRHLRSLGAGLRVEGSLDLTEAELLEELPEDLVVSRTLDLFGCSNLRRLPRSLRDNVGGRVSVFNCPNLELEEGFTIEGDVVMSFRRRLSHVPAGLHVTGDAWLSNTSLTQLPSRLLVDGDVLASHCALLERVCDDVSVGGMLSLRANPALRSIGDGVQVGGNLELAGCPRLTEIGRGVVVSGSLDLRSCPALTRLPDDLEVHGTDLILEGCQGITTVPNCVFAWLLPAEDAPPRNVHVTGSGIPDAELQRAQASLEGRVVFRTQRLPTMLESMAEQFFGGWLPLGGRGNMGSFGAVGVGVGEPEPFATLDEAAAFWATASRGGDNVDDDSDEEEQEVLVLEPYVAKAERRGVLLFLSKLRMSVEFQQRESRRGLARRVMEALRVVCDDEYAREELVTRMADAVDTCGDKPVWALNQLTLQARVARARGNREALRQLGRGVMRLSIVHDHAARKLASLGPGADDVCVYLRFEIALAERLALPVSATEMLFPRFVPITDAELSAAETEALDVSDEAFEQWLAAWPEWRRQLRQEAAQEIAFENLPRNSRRFSLSWSDLFGNVNVEDPVRIDKKGTIWSLRDLLRHWIATGLDLNNQPRSIEEMRRVTRCRSLPRRRTSTAGT